MNDSGDVDGGNIDAEDFGAGENSRPGVESFGVASDDEMVDVVDENDLVIEVVPRRVMRRDRLRHRAVFVAVVDSRARLLVHRRSESKDLWPGWFDLAVGGVVVHGEDWSMAARRELREEMGIEADEFVPLDEGRPRSYDDDEVSLLGRCWRVRHDGPVTFFDAEVAEAWWLARHEVELLIANERVLPDSLALVWPSLSGML